MAEVGKAALIGFSPRLGIVNRSDTIRAAFMYN